MFATVIMVTMVVAKTEACTLSWSNILQKQFITIISKTAFFLDLYSMFFLVSLRFASNYLLYNQAQTCRVNFTVTASYIFQLLFKLCFIGVLL